MSGETMRWIARKETKSMRRNSEGERRGYRGVCMWRDIPCRSNNNNENFPYTPPTHTYTLTYTHIHIHSCFTSSASALPPWQRGETNTSKTHPNKMVSMYQHHKDEIPTVSSSRRGICPSGGLCTWKSLSDSLLDVCRGNYNRHSSQVIRWQMTRANIRLPLKITPELGG